MTYPSNHPGQRPGDEEAGIEITEEFERFVQRNDIFTRAFWDEKVRSKHTKAFFNSYRAEAIPRRRGGGFTRKDFALRNASWLISNVVKTRYSKEGRREGFMAPISYDTPVAPDPVAVDDPKKMSAEIRRTSKFFGADLCGITDLDDRWLYASRVDSRDLSEAANDLPDGLTSVIVLGHEMDKELVATYPSALAGAATGREYSHEAAIVMQLAAYIRNLGYEAVASMNDTARGVRAFCNICTKCADACKVKALPYGPPKVGGVNPSAIHGVRKWTSDAEKCFSFWAKMTSDCAICMRVCPFNRDFSKWRHQAWLQLALSPLRKLALRLDKGRGGRRTPAEWSKDAS